MQLTNTQLANFINRIKLKQEKMPVYRDQLENLKKKLEVKIKDDDRNGLKVSKFLIAGSWKKGTILRRTGDHPIDIDLVLFIDGDENLTKDIQELHDFVVKYLEEIYPTKDILKDVDAQGKTKSIKIIFSGTGLEIDIVPVVPVATPAEYVWQPERGGGGKYILSIAKQLEFAKERKKENQSYTSIVRALKWWRNYKELKPNDTGAGLSSFNIELIVAYLDINYGTESNIEEGIIRFFKFISDPIFPTIFFSGAINVVPLFHPHIYIADPTNNENNSARKIDINGWAEIKKEADSAFEALSYAQAKNFEGDTIDEWKYVFGPSFNINEE